MTIVQRALEFVPNGSRIGLGSGRAAQAFVKALGECVRSGRLVVQGVPTSEETARLARQEGIPLLTLAEAGELDLTVDGADEVDPDLNLIKGYGRAMVREKVVAASSLRLIILVGQEKLVPRLGARGKLPVEVLSFALALCERRLSELGCRPVADRRDGELFVTDNGNHILDCQIGPIADAPRLEAETRAIPGVVGTGLFLGMADTVLVGDRRDFRLIEERYRGDRPNVETPDDQAKCPLDIGPCGAQVGEPRFEALEQAVKLRIMDRTAGRIQALATELTDGILVVRGIAPCYYVKQLALHAALDVLRSASEIVVDLKFDVRVIPQASSPWVEDDNDGNQSGHS
jgi:ribose 5-phosphate isomerase A